MRPATLVALFLSTTLVAQTTSPGTAPGLAKVHSSETGTSAVTDRLTNEHPLRFLTTTNIDFGTVPQECVVSNAITVSNAGGGILHGAVGAPNPAGPFEVLGNHRYSLGAHESITYWVTYTPTGATNDADQAFFLDNAGGSTLVALHGRLSGPYTIRQPVMSISTDQIRFGTAPYAQARTNSFTIQNRGGGVLVGTAYVNLDTSPEETAARHSNQTNADAWTPFRLLTPHEFALRSNETQIVTIRYTPSGAATSSGSVFLQWGRGWSPPTTQICLKGEMELPPKPPSNPLK